MRLEAERVRSRRMPPKKGRKKASIISPEKPRRAAVSGAEVSGRAEELLERALRAGPGRAIARADRRECQRAAVRAKRPASRSGVTRVGEPVEASRSPNDRSGAKSLEVERRIIEDGAGSG